MHSFHGHFSETQCSFGIVTKPTQFGKIVKISQYANRWKIFSRILFGFVLKGNFSLELHLLRNNETETRFALKETNIMLNFLKMFENTDLTLVNIHMYIKHGFRLGEHSSFVPFYTVVTATVITC